VIVTLVTPAGIVIDVPEADVDGAMVPVTARACGAEMSGAEIGETMVCTKVNSRMVTRDRAIRRGLSARETCTSIPSRESD
jgi:S1-C subfamily serine protease